MNEPSSPCLLEKREGRVLVLQLNRPERLNALTFASHRELTDADLDEIQMYADRYVEYRLSYMPGGQGPAA